MDINVVTCSASSIVGINNFGDELLTQIYGDWVSECDPAISVTHLAVGGHGFLRREMRGLIEVASCLIYTGGGYFAEGQIVGHSVRRHAAALRNRRVFWSVYKRARRFGVPCAVFGLEVGPLSNPPYRSAVREILGTAKKVIVRNAESGDYVRSLCGDSVAVGVQLDAALATPVGLQGDSSQADRNRSDFRVGIHVHSIDGDTPGDDCVALVEHIKSQLPSGRRVVPYYFHDQRKHGEHPSRSVRAEQDFSTVFPGLTSVPYVNPAGTMAAVRTMDLVITSKLHLGIVARSFGVPVLALGSLPKIRRFYESIEEGDACARPRSFILNGLPVSLVECLAEEQGRVPVGEPFRESASGNREAVRDLMATLI